MTFEERSGPIINLIYKHELDIATPELLAVTTTLFTMAIGVGEPTGEPQVSIIPVNVPNIRGRTLIYSFNRADSSVRGGQVVEAFMIFLRKNNKYNEDKLFRHSMPIINLLETGVKIRITRKEDFKDSFLSIANSLRKILLTDLCETAQNDLSTTCLETEKGFISDGAVRAIYNLDLTSELVDTSINVRGYLSCFSESLAKLDYAFLALPIEIHGHIRREKRIFYLESIENCYACILTEGYGRTGSLARPIKQILWDLNLKNTVERKMDCSHSKKGLTWPDELSNLTRVRKSITEYISCIKAYINLFSDYTIFHIQNDSKNNQVNQILLTNDSKKQQKHQTIAGLFINLSLLSKRMNGGELRDIIINMPSGSDMNLFLCLSWQPGFILVCESTQEIGFLGLLAEEMFLHLTSLEEINWKS